MTAGFAAEELTHRYAYALSIYTIRSNIAYQRLIYIIF